MFDNFMNFIKIQNKQNNKNQQRQQIINIRVRHVLGINWTPT